MLNGRQKYLLDVMERLWYLRKDQLFELFSLRFRDGEVAFHRDIRQLCYLNRLMEIEAFLLLPGRRKSAAFGHVFQCGTNPTGKAADSSSGRAIRPKTTAPSSVTKRSVPPPSMMKTGSGSIGMLRPSVVFIQPIGAPHPLHTLTFCTPFPATGRISRPRLRPNALFTVAASTLSPWQVDIRF